MNKTFRARILSLLVPSLGLTSLKGALPERLRVRHGRLEGPRLPRLDPIRHRRPEEAPPRGSIRDVRVNAQLIRVDRSPVSSSFGYYVGGQKGVTASLAASILF